MINGLNLSRIYSLYNLFFQIIKKGEELTGALIHNQFICDCNAGLCRVIFEMVLYKIEVN